MSTTKFITRGKQVSSKFINALTFVVVGAGFVTFGRELVWDYLRTQPEIFQNELSVSLIALSISVIVSSMIWFLVTRRSRVI